LDAARQAFRSSRSTRPNLQSTSDALIEATIDEDARLVGFEQSFRSGDRSGRPEKRDLHADFQTLATSPELELNPIWQIIEISR
jgi:hypothetical protein